MKREDMHIDIAQNRVLRDVQDDFNAAFPFLKIEFFRKSDHEQKATAARRILNQQYRIGEVRRINKDGQLDMEDNMTVAQLEKTFIDQFGLWVQVFRRSGNLWLETTMTDNWTLKQQNEHGREISAPGSRSSKTDEGDYELNRDADH